MPENDTTANQLDGQPHYANRYVKDEAELGILDGDLDRFAYYFGNKFEYGSEPTAVLVELLNRLSRVAKKEISDGSGGTSIEDVVQRLSYRLFAVSMAGHDDARKFGEAASARTAEVFARQATFNGV